MSYIPHERRTPHASVNFSMYAHTVFLQHPIHKSLQHSLLHLNYFINQKVSEDLCLLDVLKIATGSFQHCNVTTFLEALEHQLFLKMWRVHSKMDPLILGWNSAIASFRLTNTVKKPLKTNSLQNFIYSSNTLISHSVRCHFNYLFVLVLY